MPWLIPQGPTGPRPQSVAATLAQGLGSMGEQLKFYADQKREQERIAMLDQRAQDWRAEDLKISGDRYADSRADSLFDRTVNLGLVPVGSGSTPSMGSQIVAGIPGAAPAVPQGGSLSSAPPSAPVAPAAPARRTVSLQGQTFEVDPSQSFTGLTNALRQTQEREFAAAERLRRLASGTEAYTALGYTPEVARARALAEVDEFDPIYRDVTQDQQRDTTRFETNEQIRAGAPGRALEQQRIDLARQEQNATGPGALTATQQTAQNNANAAMSALDNYENIVQGYLSQGGGERALQRLGTGNRELVGQVESARNALLLEIKNMAQLGQLSGGDVEIVNQMVGDPVTWGSVVTGGGDTLARLAEARKYIQNRAGGAAPSAGPTREAAGADSLLSRYGLTPR